LALAAAAADAFASSIVSRSMKASKIISLAMLPYPLLVSTHTYMAAHTCMLHHIDGFWVACCGEVSKMTKVIDSSASDEQQYSIIPLALTSKNVLTSNSNRCTVKRMHPGLDCHPASQPAS
jgi:hypothetical protein